MKKNFTTLGRRSIYEIKSNKSVNVFVEDYGMSYQKSERYENDIQIT